MGNWWLIWFVLLVCIFLPLLRERSMLDVRRVIKKHKRKGSENMSELIKNYIGKECVIYIAGGSSNAVSGTISSCDNGWIEIKKENGQTEILQLDYISRIQEYPRGKNGKKKMVIAD